MSTSVSSTLIKKAPSFVKPTPANARGAVVETHIKLDPGRPTKS